MQLYYKPHVIGFVKEIYGEVKYKEILEKNEIKEIEKVKTPKKPKNSNYYSKSKL